MNKKFVSFITAGDPSLEKTKEFIEVLAEHSDIIEVGLPFSDPLAEGEVIEAANMRALANGATTAKLFDTLKSVDVASKLVILTYINPVFVYGCDKFFAQCKDSGVYGIIIPDLPHEERGEVAEYAAKYGIHLIPLIAPTSAERVKMLAKDGSGFIYLVSSLGTTGVRDEITTDLTADIVAQIREVTDTPVMIGFGISTPEQAETIREIADGVIVGSAFVKIIEEHGKHAAKHIRKFLKSMI
ncbi:MAG: tryptophan synthase subunit alpha [Oscillospiraceae bacterium]|nr:tryptophan synthase subunit alpha [Oscillospiraceae bacterium]